MTEKGYFLKGGSGAGGVQEMMLIYVNHPLAWPAQDALPYVAYLNPEKVPQDWFFDTFLFLALKAETGRAFDSPARATPAIKEDWDWFLNRLFTPGEQLSAFDQAVAQAQVTLGPKKAKVILMIPNPMAQIEDFGEIGGQRISFSPEGRSAQEVTESRFTAVRWYMEKALQMWEEANFQNLEFLGFYWVEEMVHKEIPGEVDLFRQTADWIHQKDLFFYWIPWFNAQGHAEWEELGFDLCIQQPNYMFNDKVPRSRFADAANLANTYGQGVEIEADGRILSSVPARERFYDYLRAGLTHGYIDAVHGYYQDSQVFLIASRSQDPEVRAIYDQMYRFTKRKWTQELEE